MLLKKIFTLMPEIMDSEDGESLLSALYYIKQQILETSSFGKYRFNAGLPGVLGFLQKNLGY